MEGIDAELLIQEVKAKPVLWDKFQSIYKDRVATRYAWREVCEALYPNFNDIDTRDQDAFRAEVIKRWTNLRDSFIKYKKKLVANVEIGPLAPTMKKYIYADQLAFLSEIYGELEIKRKKRKNKVKDHINEIEMKESKKQNKEKGHMTTQVVDPIFDFNLPTPPSSTKKQNEHRNIDKTDMKIIKEIDEEKPCSKMAFLQSLMPHLEKFNNTEFLQFQMGTLKIIENIYAQKAHHFQLDYANQPSSSVQFITPDNIPPSSNINISAISAGEEAHSHYFGKNTSSEDEDDSIDIKMLM